MKIVVFIILSLCVSAVADTRIKGKVIDSKSKEPLVRATVRLTEKRTADHNEEHTAGGFTDSLGNFNFKAPHRGMFDLSVKTVGYQERIIAIELRDDEYILGDIMLSPIENDEVVISAERYFTAIEDACCNVEAINREFADLAPFSPSPTQLLRRYSSCTSSQIHCSIDHSSSVRLRGLSGSRILLYLDGLPVFGAMTSAYALQQIPSAAIANMRIYEGVSSVQYGNGAISGVVDFETKPPAEPNELSIISNIASPTDNMRFAQRDVSASYVGGLNDDVGIAGFISYNGHSLERDAGTFSNVPSYDRLSGLIKSRLVISNNSRLTLGILGARESRFGGEDTTVDNYTEDIRSSQITAYAKYDINLDDARNLFTSVMYANGLQDSRFGSTAFNGRQNIFYGSAYMMDVHDAHQIKYGAEFRREELTDAESLNADYDYNTVGAYAEDEWLIGSGWSLVAGLRYDHHSYSGSLVSPRAAISYRFTDAFKLRFSTGQGFKGQALIDEEHLIYHGVYRYRNNTNITYERSWTYNVDAALDYALGDLYGTANAIFYYTPVTNRFLPQADSAAAGTLYYVNSPYRGRIVGFELQTRPRFGDHWSGAFGLSLISNQQTIGQYTGIYMLVPERSIDLSIMYNNDESGWQAECWSSVIGKQLYSIGARTVRESPTYTLANFRLAKQLGSVQIFAGILNIFDSRQYTVSPTAVREGKYVYSTSVWGSLEGRELFFGVKVTM